MDLIKMQIPLVESRLALSYSSWFSDLGFAFFCALAPVSALFDFGGMTMKKILISVLVLLTLLCLVACNDTSSTACPECGYKNSSGVKFCSDCGASMSSPNNNQNNGGNNGDTSCQHSFGEWQEKASADCTNTGTKERTCSKCSHEETQSITALGHTTTTGICSRCNKRMGWTKEEAQSLIKVYSVYVDDINSAGGVDLKIGWENTSNKELKYVYFTVEAYNSVWDKAYCEIRDHNAFTGRTIGPFAPGYNNLYYSSFDDTYTPTSVWEECYYNHTIKYFVLTQVRLVYMDESEETISGDAIEYVLCDYPSTLSYSWDDDYNGYKVEYRLKNQFNKQKMSIPLTYNGSFVTSIGYRAFENMNFSSVEIPKSIKYIGSSAFSGCTNLKEVIIPNGVEVIDSFAFDGCTSLTKVTIPNSVTTIDYAAFGRCSNFEIIFEGTPEEWDAIYKDSSWSYNTDTISFTFVGQNNSNNDNSNTDVSGFEGAWHTGYTVSIDGGATYYCESFTIDGLTITTNNHDKNEYFGASTETAVLENGTLVVYGSASDWYVKITYELQYNVMIVTVNWGDGEGETIYYRSEDLNDSHLPE